MSALIPAILFFSAIITIEVLVVVLILIIPLRIALSFRSNETETRAILSGSWLVFRLEVLVSGKDPQASVMVGRVRLITRSLFTFIESSQKHAGFTGPGRIPDIFSSWSVLRGPGLDSVLDLIRRTRFDYARGNMRIGFGDPSATGMLYGLFRAFASLLPMDRITLNIVPEFNREVFEIDITTRFHIMYPIRIIANAVKIVKHPATRQVMKTMRKRPMDVGE